MAVSANANIRALDLAQLTAALKESGLPAFRARQIHKWLWQKHTLDFALMSDLPAALRADLAERFVTEPIAIADRRVSADGTVKFAFSLHDGPIVEGVLIPTTDRLTACVSSQAGCSLSCKFCATGYLPLKRNLNFYEIFDQVALINAESLATYGRPLTNIVYMGMGEPLLNYRNVLASIERITAPDGLGMSPRRITVSTAGIARMIKKLGDDEVKFEFALSLHAGTDEKRSKLMPINDSNSLEALTEALNYFYNKTGTRVTLEYTVLFETNDSLDDADELAAFARRVKSKINLIEYNPIDFADFRKTSAARLDAFVARLESYGLIVNVRRSRGKDVDAACGQLANKNAAVGAPVIAG